MQARGPQLRAAHLEAPLRRGRGLEVARGALRGALGVARVREPGRDLSVRPDATIFRRP